MLNKSTVMDYLENYLGDLEGVYDVNDKRRFPSLECLNAGTYKTPFFNTHEEAESYLKELRSVVGALKDA